MIRTRIAGIPCQIKVTYLDCEPDGIHGIPEYEIEFQVYDGRGFRARYLESRITEEKREKIKELIIKCLNEDAFPQFNLK